MGKPKKEGEKPAKKKKVTKPKGRKTTKPKADPSDDDGNALEVGRPTKFREEYSEQARKLCLLGFTDKELADFFGVCERTLNYWKGEHPEFLQALQRGKVLADADVAASLYHRACGYSHPEDKFFQYEGHIMVEQTTKHYPPDTAAAFIWLKNRAGWRDKPEAPEDEDVLPVKVEVQVIDARKSEDA